MRIAVIVTSFPELSQTFILNQITGLIDRGHEVDIFADRHRESNQVHPDVYKYGILDRTYCIRMPANLLFRVLKGVGLWAYLFLKRPSVAIRALNVLRYRQLAAGFVLIYAAMPLLNKKAYDVVHCHFGPNGLKGIFFRESGLLSGKIVTTFHGYDVNAYPLRYGVGVYKRLFRDGDFFTANTAFTMRRAIDLGCPVERIVTLPVGVDLNRFTPVEKNLADSKVIRILTVGRLCEVKGIEFAIRAIATLTTRHPGILYQIVGDGPLRESLVDLAEQLGVSRQIEFLGGLEQDRVLELYAQAQIFVLPGIVAGDGAEEGQGLVLVEAQASGIPVVASRVGGIPETLVEGESGFLVPQRDVDALAERIELLIENPVLREKMGSEGRRFVGERYDIERLNDELVRVFERVGQGAST